MVVFNPFSFITLGLRSLLFSVGERKRQTQVVQKFYKDLIFKEIDKYFIRLYKGINPYHIVRDLLLSEGADDPYTYGETPLLIYHQMGSILNLTKGDIFVELGSGRGRGALFLAHFFQCQVIGIEKVPLFVEIAKEIQTKFGLSATFSCENFVSSPLITKANVVYLYGLCLDDEDLYRLATVLKESKPYIISVSFPFDEYAPWVHCIHRFEVRFPWGKTEIFISK